MMKRIKNRWKQVGNDIGATPRYFQQSPSNLLQRDAIQSQIEKYADGKMLDVGAGRSVYKQFIPKTVEYRSMDFQETQNEYEKNQKLDYIGDAQNMPIADNHFETILCTEVLEHLPHPEKAAQEIIRVLKPGGHAIITVPFLGYYHNEPWDYYRFTSHGLRALFENDTIKIIHEEPLGGFFVYVGYIRSTILLSLTYHIPLIGVLLFQLNLLCSKIDIWLDKITKNGSIMPVTNVLVIKKTRNK